MNAMLCLTVTWLNRAGLSRQSYEYSAGTERVRYKVILNCSRILVTQKLITIRQLDLTSKD